MKTEEVAKKSPTVMKLLFLSIVVRLTITKAMAAQVGVDRNERYERCRRKFKKICKANDEFCISELCM